jgi:hypothetical protein
MTRIPLTEPEPPISFRVNAIYCGSDYPNLTQGQEYKLSLTYDYESTWIVTTNKDDVVLTMSGLYDLCTNFTQICKL